MCRPATSRYYFGRLLLVLLVSTCALTTMLLEPIRDGLLRAPTLSNLHHERKYRINWRVEVASVEPKHQSHRFKTDAFVAIDKWVIFNDRMA